MRKFLQQNVSIAVVIFVTLVGRASFADHYVVPTGSMEPTVEPGDRVIVDKAAYGFRAPLTHDYLVRFSTPKAGDVVVLDSPVDDKVLLKRVAATPGDNVVVRDGVVTLNGIEQPALRHGGPDFGPTTLGADQYLMMGDNRGNSFDGRSFGYVSASTILGRAEVIYWHDSALSWRSLRR